MINREILNDCIEKYTEVFSERWGDDKKGECFKWKMVNSFRKNWDLDAIDFVGMLKLSLKDASYLLDSAQNLPYGMLLDLAKADPVAVHQMFEKLYTENNDVVARIREYKKGNNLMSLTSCIDIIEKLRVDPRFLILGDTTVPVFMNDADFYVMSDTQKCRMHADHFVEVIKKLPPNKQVECLGILMTEVGKGIEI